MMFLLEVAVSVIALVVFLYFIGTWNYDHFKKQNIPCIEPKPFVGNLGSFIIRKKSFSEILVEVYNTFKGHRVVGYFEFLTPVTVIMEPELIRQITVKDFDYFTDHKLPIREDADPMFGKNMFSLEGQRWREMRTTLSPAFTSSKMKSMFLLIRDTGTQMATYLDKEIKASKDGMIVREMKDLLTRYANDVIATAAFGFQCNSMDEPNNEFYKVGRAITNFEGRVGMIATGYFFSAKLMKLLNITIVSKEHANFFRSLVHGNMATRERENIIRPDMIHLLMQAKKGTLKHDVTDEASAQTTEDNDKKKTVTELTDDDLTAQALLFFLAGFDTAATLLSFMSHLLAVHPDVQARVQQEIDDILQEQDGKLTYEGMQRMTYLDMVINETLRLYPPTVFNERQCTKSYTIEATDTSPAVHIKKGDAVVIPVNGLHLDPEYFPDPHKFDPERFSEENKHNIKPFTFMPFGSGPRVCIGMRFAIMEAKVAFTSLLSHFNLEVVSKTSVPIVLSRKSFNLNAKDGFWVGIRCRDEK